MLVDPKKTNYGPGLPIQIASKTVLYTKGTLMLPLLTALSYLGEPASAVLLSRKERLLMTKSFRLLAID